MTTDMVPTGRIVIAGGSGFLGVNLARYLANFDCEVLLISRNRPAQKGEWEHATWDARTLGDWVAQVDGAAAVVNLVGRTVDCVKSPDHCDEILRSRVEATELLCKGHIWPPHHNRFPTLILCERFDSGRRRACQPVDQNNFQSYGWQIIQRHFRSRTCHLRVRTF